MPGVWIGLTIDELRSLKKRADKERKSLSALFKSAFDIPTRGVGRPKSVIPCCKCRKPFQRSRLAAHERKCSG